jgi:tripartite-type tricarboxylate transporter receptor subunit TctC
MTWFMRLAVALMTAMLCAAEASAQQYPARPIRIIVPFAPGGGTDSVARIIQPSLQATLGQTIVIENRPGAGTNLGTAAAAQAAPDGYTLLVTLDQTMAMNPFLYDNLSFNPERDFAPISMLALGPRLYVSNPKAPAKTLKELIAYAKANPDKLNYASGAISGRVTGEHLMEKTGAKMVFIPYGGGSPALVALLANDVQFVIADMGTFAPGVKDGRLVGLAVSGSKRSPQLPDVPSLGELGYGELENATWWAMFAPAGTPKPIIDTLNAAVLKAMADADVRKRISAMGNEPLSSTPDEVSAWLKRDAARWGPVIKKAGIKAN